MVYYEPVILYKRSFYLARIRLFQKNKKYHHIIVSLTVNLWASYAETTESCTRQRLTFLIRERWNAIALTQMASTSSASTWRKLNFSRPCLICSSPAPIGNTTVSSETQAYGDDQAQPSFSNRNTKTRSLLWLGFCISPDVHPNPIHTIPLQSVQKFAS